MPKINLEALGESAATLSAPVVPAPVVPAPVPAVDARAALAKLTSGQTLTTAEKQVLGMAPATTTSTVTSTASTSTASTSTASTSASTSSTTDLWQMLNGILYKNKVPFTGVNGNQRYENGVLTETATKDENGNLVWKKVGSSSTSKTSTTTSGSDITLVSTSVDPTTGAVIGYFSDGSTKTLTAGGLSKTETDAYALLEQTFKNYGLDSLVPVIQDYMKKNLGSEQAALQLRQTEQYKTRFAGNTIRLAAGQNALTEAEYLNLENSYIETLNAYGLKNYFGTDRTSQIANMAKVIGGDVAAPEFASRVSTVIDRVQNADPIIKAQLKAFYNIDDADLVKYYLNPDQNLAALKQKTLTAEIGAAAVAQGLEVQKTSAEALAAQGVTQQQAQQGYKTVAEVLPTATKLSGIYGENKLDYGQAEAEADVFGTTGAASAQRKRRQMAALESAAFSGRSGVDLENIAPLGARTRGYSF